MHYKNGLEISIYVFFAILFITKTLKKDDNILFNGCNPSVSLINFMTYVFVCIVFVYLGGLYKFEKYKMTDDLTRYNIVSSLIFAICYFILKFVLEVSEDTMLYFISGYIIVSAHTYYEYKTAGEGNKDEWWKSAGVPGRDNIMSNSIFNSIGDTIALILAIFTVFGAYEYYNYVSGKNVSSGVFCNKKLLLGIIIFLYLLYEVSGYLFDNLSTYMKKRGRIVGNIKLSNEEEKSLNSLRVFRNFNNDA